MHHSYILLSFIVFIIGLVVYVTTDNAKRAEIGRCAMWCGLVVTLLALMYDRVPLF